MEEHQRTTIRMSRELHLASRIKAIQLRTNLSEVVRRFLAAWVEGDIAMPEPREEVPDQEE